MRFMTIITTILLCASTAWGVFGYGRVVGGGVAASGSVPTVVASDNFNSYTHGTQLSATADWTTVLNGFVTLDADTIRGTASVPSYNAAFWDANSFNANQYSEAILGTVPGSGDIYSGCAVRASVSGGSKPLFYGLITNGATVKLFSYNGDDTGSEYNEIASYTQSISAGSGLKLEVSGTGASIRLAAYYGSDGSGWTSLATGIDPTDEFDSGSAGVAYLGNSNVTRITSWEGGNL